MKSLIAPATRNILLLITPFAFMILINGCTSVKEHNHSYLKIRTINSNDKNPGYCTWACHNRTEWCREHHVKIPDKYREIADIPYDSLITSLRKGNKLYKGDYQVNNILYLVILVPFAIWYFIVSGLILQDKISNFQNNART
jgi:hypothetical protein